MAWYEHSLTTGASGSPCVKQWCEKAQKRGDVFTLNTSLYWHIACFCCTNSFCEGKGKGSKPNKQSAVYIWLNNYLCWFSEHLCSAEVEYITIVDCILFYQKMLLKGRRNLPTPSWASPPSFPVPFGFFERLYLSAPMNERLPERITRSENVYMLGENLLLHSLPMDRNDLCLVSAMVNPVGCLNQSILQATWIWGLFFRMSKKRFSGFVG